MNVVIIDNDEKIRLGLRTMIEKFCPQITQLNEGSSIKTGIEAISKHQPDLVFLDVELDEGTGMDLLSKLNSYNFDVVFITAFNKYAVDAFKFSAIDFILKPIGLDDLLNSIQKTEQKRKLGQLEEQLKVLRENLKDLSKADKKIVLRDSSNLFFVKIRDIIFCKAEGSYTEFYIEGNQKIVTSSMLKEYESMLETYGFLRTHHSYLVNLNKIERFDKSDGGSLLMSNKKSVPVSQRKKDQVLEILSKL